MIEPSAKDSCSTESSSSSRPSAEDVRPDVAGIVARLRSTSSKAFGSWPWELCLQAAAIIETLAGERTNEDWSKCDPQSLGQTIRVLQRSLAEAERQLAEYRADAERWKLRFHLMRREVRRLNKTIVLFSKVMELQASRAALKRMHDAAAPSPRRR